MEKKIKDLIKILIIIIVILFILVYFEADNKILYTTIIIMLAYMALEYFIGNFVSKVTNLFSRASWKTTQRKFEKEGKLQQETQIRISFAYLFRIKIDNKYFLVPNSRSGKYQPVGGAYKFNEEEANYLSENIPVEDDDCIPVDQTTKWDYRLLVKNKDLRAFVKRFNKTPNRENIEDLSREFTEEIFTSDILNKEEFGDLTYKYCGRHMTNIEQTVFKPFEMLLADIIEVRLTEEQEELFRKLMYKNSMKYRFVDFQEIESLGVKVGTHELSDNITNHTYKILSGRSDDLIMRNKYKKPITIKFD